MTKLGKSFYQIFINGLNIGKKRKLLRRFPFWCLYFYWLCSPYLPFI